LNGGRFFVTGSGQGFDNNLVKAKGVKGQRSLISYLGQTPAHGKARHKARHLIGAGVSGPAILGCIPSDYAAKMLERGASAPLGGYGHAAPAKSRAGCA
jgi:hypothetical protein